MARYRDALGDVAAAGVRRRVARAGRRRRSRRWSRATRARTRRSPPPTQPPRAGAVAGRSSSPSLARARRRGRAAPRRVPPGGARRRAAAIAEVLRLLRRRTLARLRDAGRARRRGGARALPAALARRRLAAPRPARAARRDRAARRRRAAVLRARARASCPRACADYHPRMLDELGATGELVWIGARRARRDDGRVALYRRDRARSLAPEPPRDSSCRRRSHAAILAHLARARRVVLRRDRACRGAARARTRSLAALWDLVWAGLVTNDTFAPLRALARAARAGRARAPHATSGGRWSLRRVAAGPAPRATRARAHARALALLERYGVVSREAARAPRSCPAASRAVAAVLRAMEDAGHGAPRLLRRRARRRAVRARRRRSIACAPPATPAATTWPALARRSIPRTPTARSCRGPRPATATATARAPARAGGKRRARARRAGVLRRARRRQAASTSPAPSSTTTLVEPRRSPACARLAAQPRLPASCASSRSTACPRCAREHATLLERAGFRVEPGGLVAPGSE